MRDTRTSRLGAAQVAWTALLAVTALAFAGGCRSGPVPATRIADDERVLVSSELRGSLAAQVKADWTSDGRLKANVVIRNVTSKSLLVYISTIFKDKNGVSLNPEPVQDAIIINVGQDYTYSKASLHDKAQDFSVRILKGRSY